MWTKESHSYSAIFLKSWMERVFTSTSSTMTSPPSQNAIGMPWKVLRRWIFHICIALTIINRSRARSFDSVQRTESLSSWSPSGNSSEIRGRKRSSTWSARTTCWSPGWTCWQSQPSSSSCWFITTTITITTLITTRIIITPLITPDITISDANYVVPNAWFWKLLVWSGVIWGSSGVILKWRIAVCEN